jgi:uncharacterized protein YciI
MLYIVYQVDKPDSVALRDRLREEHFAYLAKHEDILVLGGAMLSDDGKGRTGSVLIVNVKSRAEADAFSANEPFRKGGLFQRVEINRMRRGQWNPAAAPKTPEGN